MNSIQMYTELCRIDMINNNMESMYPYTLQDDVEFTQHELVLHYKKNYCENVRILEDSHEKNGLSVEGGASKEESKYIYMLF